MARVEFHFDFGSPNAYLAHKVLPGIEARTGARFEYVPILLGGVFKATNNRSPMEAFAGIRNKPEYEALQTRRFVARHGLEAFRFNPNFPINTLQLMRGAVVAQRLGVFEAYVEAVFKAMWEDQKPMGDAEVFTGTLRSAGLDAEGLIALSQDPEVKAALVANTEASVARGTFGSPTFFVGDEIYFGKDSLGDVEAAIRAA
jgi:2-hydroxychromene-2-carboxylate isomerase